jgi:DNA-binding response OmpR family regulator
MRILLIEDDKKLARLLTQAILDEGWQVDAVHEGNGGLELLLRDIYDVAVVDWMLPGRDGPAICRSARSAGVHTALLLLTARSQIEDRVTGLDSGADDYLSKPFAFEELIARLRALSRRHQPNGGDREELRVGDLVMDLRAHTARRGGFTLDLTSTEWNLLEFFLRHPGQSLSRQQILDYVWSYQHDVQFSMVDVYISYLRRKLNLPGYADPIQTVRGIGYRLNAD